MITIPTEASMKSVESAMQQLGFGPEQIVAHPEAQVLAKRLAVAANTQAAAQIISLEKVKE